MLLDSRIFGITADGGASFEQAPVVALSGAGRPLFGSGIPYAVTHPGARVVGTLITTTPVLYSEVLADLDRLEGYDSQRPETSHYIRTTTSVIATNALPGGGTWEAFHTAWIYLAGTAVDPDTMTRVPGDDWLAHVSAR